MVDTLSLISVCSYRCEHNHVDDIDKSVNKSCIEYCFWYLLQSDNSENVVALQSIVIWGDVPAQMKLKATPISLALCTHQWIPATYIMAMQRMVLIG